MHISQGTESDAQVLHGTARDGLLAQAPDCSCLLMQMLQGRSDGLSDWTHATHSGDLD